MKKKHYVKKRAISVVLKEMVYQFKRILFKSLKW